MAKLAVKRRDEREALTFLEARACENGEYGRGSRNRGCKCGGKLYGMRRCGAKGRALLKWFSRLPVDDPHYVPLAPKWVQLRMLVAEERTE
jgi:hypothetical protein